MDDDHGGCCKNVRHFSFAPLFFLVYELMTSGNHHPQVWAAAWVTLLHFFCSDEHSIAFMAF